MKDELTTANVKKIERRGPRRLKPAPNADPTRRVDGAMAGMAFSAVYVALGPPYFNGQLMAGHSLEPRCAKQKWPDQIVSFFEHLGQLKPLKPATE